ncbi:MAG: hypothetical protein ABI472_16380 [Ginsengibacter sp.]
MHNALARCKNQQYKGPVYCGTNLPVLVIEEHRSALKKKKPITNPYFISTSKDAGKAFAGKNVYRENEEEILFNKDTRCNMISIEEDDENGVTYIQMEEA